MKERPIIFNSESVGAILEGRKTQTRRIVKDFNMLEIFKIPNIEKSDVFKGFEKIKCPYGKIGDRLWVREKWADMICVASTKKGKGKGEKSPSYWATSDEVEREILKSSWKPSIFMPRWASRINLEITDIRVERLQEISPKDVIAEGIVEKYGDGLALRDKFENLWNSIHKKEYTWQDNPWVWIIEFIFKLNRFM